MAGDLKDFWRRFQSGVQVAAATDGQLPDKLLGIRDGFLRYFHDGLALPVSVSVVPQVDAAPEAPVDENELLRLVRRRVDRLRGLPGQEAAFVVGCEAGIVTVEVDGDRRNFVRTWALVSGFGEEAWGSSASLELPRRLIDGLDRPAIGRMVPGTRRGGGMVSSLTGGLESRRQAAAQATLHALASLFYGVLEPPPGGPAAR